MTENIEILETKANNVKEKVQEAKVATTKPVVEERKSNLGDKIQPQEMDRSSVQISGGSKQSNGSGNAQHERRGR